MALRHEWKHRIDTAGLLALRARLGAVLQRDPHALGGSYQVRSLYFDNLADKALREKLESVNHREKFRLRFYNGDLSLLMLEKKTKTNGLCGKAQTPLTVEEARALLEGRHQELGASSPLLGELCRKMDNQGLQAAAREMGYESRLFDTAAVHTIDIVMEDWEGFLETAQREEYSLCSLVIDGETYENVAIRGKGNTSLTQVEQYGNSRYSFKVEFDHYDNALSYYGLDKLSLNNLIQDNTMLKDYLCYQLMGSFGVDAPLCCFVYITVNGEDWGLYLAVEGVEESFLQRNYGSGYGELYKPDSQSMGGGRGNGGAFSLGDWQQEAAGETGGAAAGSQDTFPAAPDGLDSGFPGQEGFSPGTEGEMPEGGAPELPEDPEGGGFSMGSDDTALLYTDDAYSSYQNIFDNAKTDVTDSDKDRLIASLKQLNAQENLEEVVDVEEVIRYFVVHNFVCNFDSYTGSMIHNYYLYEEDGQLSMIPWDYNLAFGGFLGSSDATALVNYPIDTPVSGGTVDSRPMLAWIFSSEEYTQLYHQYFSQFLAEWFDSGAFAQAFQQVVDLITPYVEKDPTKFCTTEEFQAGVEALEDFCLLRAQSIQGQLEGAIPSTDEGQSEDSSTLVDASSVDISAMGTMENGGGQRSWERGMGQSQEAVEGAGISAATQDSAGQAPAIPQGQEDMGSPPELPSGEGPQRPPAKQPRTAPPPPQRKAHPVRWKAPPGRGIPPVGRKVLPPQRSSLPSQTGPWGKSLPPSRQKGPLTLG